MCLLLSATRWPLTADPTGIHVSPLWTPKSTEQVSAVGVDARYREKVQRTHWGLNIFVCFIIIVIASSQQHLLSITQWTLILTDCHRQLQQIGSECHYVRQNLYAWPMTVGIAFSRFLHICTFSSQHNLLLHEQYWNTINSFRYLSTWAFFGFSGGVVFVFITVHKMKINATNIHLFA